MTLTRNTERATFKSEIGDLELAYQYIPSQGKTPSILIHGAGGDMDIWTDSFVERLAVLGPVLMFDLPGCGQSDKPEDLVYSMEMFARAALHLQRITSLGPAVFVGHSIGTGILRLVWRLDPDAAISLVNIDGPTFYADEPVEIYDYDMDTFWDWWKGFVEAMIKENTPDWLETLIRESLLDSAPRKIIYSTIRELLNPSVCYNDDVTVPYLVVNAADFVHADLELAPKLKPHIPRVECVIVDGGHFPMLENPARLSSLIVDFVSRWAGK